MRESHDQKSYNSCSSHTYLIGLALYLKIMSKDDGKGKAGRSDLGRSRLISRGSLPALSKAESQPSRFIVFQ